ncbi:hypothetical protein [Rhizocola hellebori]|uniref:hypothetical protein n=1 Tax=Rhizocola hellebori TaxID=1392758 RepID=UPI001944D0C4|nr:hypothetical protein [Rhizocola hellebori]
MIRTASAASDQSAKKVQIPSIHDTCDHPLPIEIFRIPTGLGAEWLATVTNVDGIAGVAWSSPAAAGVIDQGRFSCRTVFPIVRGRLSTWPSALGSKLAEEGLSASLIEHNNCEQSGDTKLPVLPQAGCSISPDQPPPVGYEATIDITRITLSSAQIWSAFCWRRWQPVSAMSVVHFTEETGLSGNRVTSIGIDNLGSEPCTTS